MPDCFKIFEWWQDKYITEDGSVTQGPGLKVVANGHLASCWACGKAVKSRDILSWDKYDIPPKELWSTKRVNSVLDRAHIVAKQFGGPNTPDNLFLLCSDCHYDSPDTRNRAAFLRWVYRRRKRFAYGIDMIALQEEIAAEIEARGYSPDQFLGEYFAMRGLSEYNLCETAFEKGGLHGGKIVVSTVVTTLIDEMERRVLASRKETIAQREQELAI